MFLPKRILFLTDSDARAYDWQRGQLTFVARFAGGDDPDLEEFEQWLRLQRRVPIFVVADVIELDFRYETIPHAVLREGQQLRQRKLVNMYRATPFRHALGLGREQIGRRDDRILFSAITNPDALAPWLPLINKQKAPLAGICAPPLLLSKAGKAFKDAHVLLVNRDSHSGLRLTYFFNGELRFSRLAPHFLETPAELGPILVEEVARTQQYLLNLKLIGRDDTLHITVADHTPLLTSWQDALPSTRLLQFEAISLTELARQAGARSFKESDSYVELLAILSAQGFAQNHYGTGPYLHEAYLRLVRVTAQMTAIALTALGVLIMASEAFTLYELNHQTEQFNTSTKLAQQKYQQIKTAFPAAPASAAAMQEADAVIAKLTSEKMAPQRLLADISHALDKAPAIQLTKLTWRYGDPQDTTGDDPTKLNAARAARPNPDPGAAGNAGSEKKWHALLEGEIPATIKQRDALAAVDAVTQALSRKDVSVEVLRLPYNVRPDAPLEGKSGGALPQQPTQPPTITLRIIWNTPATAP